MFGCYLGSCPPTRVFMTGGNPAMNGVYTFKYRQLLDDRCAYQKEGSKWQLRWVAKVSRWVCSEINEFAEAGAEPDTFGSAYAEEDVPDPTLAENWQQRRGPAAHMFGRQKKKVQLNVNVS